MFVKKCLILSIKPNGAFDKTRHNGNAHPTAGNDENLDEFSFSFKILSHHQCRTIPSHTNTNSCKQNNKFRVVTRRSVLFQNT